LYLRNVYSALK